MPPFQSRSTGARSSARISSLGAQRLAVDVERRAQPAATAGSTWRVRENTPPPSRDQLAVVVVPRRARRARTGARAPRSCARRRGRGRGRRGGGRTRPTSRMCCDSSMPLPNTSPDMSPMPTTVKSSLLHVVAELAEVALDRLPGAARGDAHLLVVVAARAARGERVAQPEAVLARDAVGDVGEAWPCPCRRRPPGRGRRRRSAPRRGGGTISPPTMLSVRSSRPLMKVR